MIGKIIAFVAGLVIGTVFGWMFLEKVIELLLARLF